MSDTIAAISTPAAPAGLGVIRLSGEDALSVAGRVFRPADPARAPEKLAGYTAAYGHVYDADGDIDDAVLLVFRATAIPANMLRSCPATADCTCFSARCGPVWPPGHGRRPRESSPAGPFWPGRWT